MVIHHEIAKIRLQKEMKISEKGKIFLPAMGRSITGGGDNGAVAEVATSFPAHCLGAIRT